MTTKCKEKDTSAAKIPQEKTLAWHEELSRVYREEGPGLLGFLTFSHPIASITDSILNVPPDNGVATRAAVTLVSIAGLQPALSRARKHLYDKFYVYWMSERTKRIFDGAYGAVAGALFNPAFHWLTKKTLNLSQSVPLEDAIISGGLVGGAAGVGAWLVSDAYAHTWEIQNTPSREIKVPGANYLKSLPGNIKKTLAIGTTLLSLTGTAAFYTHRHYDAERAKLPQASQYSSQQLESRAGN